MPPIVVCMLSMENRLTYEDMSDSKHITTQCANTYVTNRTVNKRAGHRRSLR